MTKKKTARPKHQKDVGDTSEEELNTQNLGKVCPHVQRAVNFGRVKKILKRGNFNSCSGCNTEDAEEEEEVWLCLQCGYVGCGRNSTNKHMMQHFKTLHSDCHSLVLSPGSGCVWCYDCDDEVSLQSSNNLRQCVEFIMKLKMNNNHMPNESNTVTSDKKPEQLSLIECVLKDMSFVEKVKELEKETAEDKKEDKEKMGTPAFTSDKKPEQPSLIKGEPRDLSLVKEVEELKKESAENNKEVKGTRTRSQVSPVPNVKSLSQTHLLLKEVEDSHSSDVQWPVPKLTIEDDLIIEDTIADPLQLDLPRECQLLKSFLKFLKNMTSASQNKNEIVNPSDLFHEIQKKSPQFQCYHQQDSHELLRQFLDNLRQEEVKRQKRAILNHFKIGNANQEISDYVRKLIKAYGSYASHTLVEKVFGGLLISTVLCEECKTSSQIFEPFMDLSLPLFEEKQQDQLCPLLDGGKSKKASRKFNQTDLDENEFILTKPKQDSGKPSKHMDKKQKMMLKKQKKAQRKKSITNLSNKIEEKEAVSDECPEIGSQEIGESNNPSEKDSDKEATSPGDSEKDNMSDDAQTSVLEHVTSKLEKLEIVIDRTDGSDLCLETTEKEEIVTEIAAQNNFVESPDLSSEEANTPLASPDLPDSVVSLESVVENEEEPEDDNVSEANLESLSEHMHTLSMQISSVRIRKDSDRTQLSLTDDSAKEDDDQDDDEEWGQGFSQSQTKEWVVKSLSPLQPRPHLSSQECSILSCLSHFTKPELLSGNNKFRCDNCTELKRRRTGDKKAVAYSNASKQLLVFSPPAILTLHLKRFQQVGMSLRKVNRFVEFPLLLDIAPYCSSACLVLPHMSSVKNSVLYSLYAIVEHSGRLTSGHYTAYVKLSNRLADRRGFLNALPQCGDLTQLLKKLGPTPTRKANERDEENCQMDREKWFYVSDTMVREASESQVLKCQAYLLFYERIK